MHYATLTKDGRIVKVTKTQGEGYSKTHNKPQGNAEKVGASNCGEIAMLIYSRFNVDLP